MEREMNLRDGRAFSPGKSHCCGNWQQKQTMDRLFVILIRSLFVMSGSHPESVSVHITSQPDRFASSRSCSVLGGNGKRNEPPRWKSVSASQIALMWELAAETDNGLAVCNLIKC